MGVFTESVLNNSNNNNNNQHVLETFRYAQFKTMSVKRFMVTKPRSSECRVKQPKDADWDSAKAFSKQRSALNFRRQVDHDQTVHTERRFRREVKKRKVVRKLGGFKLRKKSANQLIFSKVYSIVYDCDTHSSCAVATTM